MSCHSLFALVHRLSQKKPFIFFSSVLLLYTILQLLISYHIIETEFRNTETHHTHHQSYNIELVNTIDTNIQKEYESTSFEGCDPIAIDYKWGQTFTNQKIACMILSLYPRNKILMQFIGETYGKYCDGLFFVLDDSKTHWFNKTIHEDANRKQFSRKPHFMENSKIINESIANIPLTHQSQYFGGTIIQLNLSRPSHHTQRNTWEKVHRMYTYFYVHYLHEYDWFVRIDDDVLVSMLNLRDYLSFYSTADDVSYYIGHTLLDRFKRDNIVYNAGNLHALNRNALRKLGPLLMTLPTAQSAHDAHAHCMDFIAGNDDPHLGTCLNALGIYPVNTMDYQLKNRFMVFRNSDHYNIKKEDSWYWKERPFDMGSMQVCCNEFAMNDHPWIHISGHLQWRQKFTKMSEAKWNNAEYINKKKQEYIEKGNMREVIPPKPCTFMFNTNNTFIVDKYYNIDYDEIPKGQRISFGAKDLVKCHRCKVGDPEDLYWNNEWDRSQLMYKINENNKHKFYEISQYFPNQLISTRFDIDANNKFISTEPNDNAHKLQSLIDQALDPNVKSIRLI